MHFPLRFHLPQTICRLNQKIKQTPKGSLIASSESPRRGCQSLDLVVRSLLARIQGGIPNGFF
jgi:hypothetical protein